MRDEDVEGRSARIPVGSPEFYQAVVETAVSPFVVIDAQLNLSYASPTIESQLGLEISDWIGRNVGELLTEDSVEVALIGLTDMRMEPDDANWMGAPVRIFLKHGDGSVLAFDAESRSIERTGIDGIVVQLHRAGGPQTMIDVIDAILEGEPPDRTLRLLARLIEHDITETKAALATGWDGLRFTQTHGSAGYLQLDDLHPVDRDAIRRALTSTREVVDIFDRLHPDTCAAARADGFAACWIAPLATNRRQATTAALVVWHVLPGPPGALYRTDIRRSVNLAGLAMRWIGHQHQLEWNAAHDRLTRLANRGELQNRLEAGDGHPRAVLYCDLDDFKPVNDRFGHRVGDEVLAAVAGRLRTAAGNHVVARMGGDEFAVLVDPLEDPEVPRALAATIFDALQSPITALGHLAQVGVSIGLAIDATGRAGSDELLDEADRLLRLGKSEGKNQVRVVEL